MGNSTNNKPQSNSIQEITAVVLSTNSIEIQIDENYQLNYTVLPQNAKDTEITWSSTDDAVASIDSAGIITGISKGQTNVIAECENGVYAVCSVTVIEKSAYDSLSSKEKKFVDLFVDTIDVFYNPNSVSIKYYHENPTGVWHITVSAHNQMGGFSEQDYTLDSSGNLTKPILGHVIIHDWENDCNLDLINQAIQEYIE